MINITVNADRTITRDKAVLGVDSENNVEVLSITTPTAYTAVKKYVEFLLPDGTAEKSAAIGEGVNTFTYSVPSAVLQQGFVKLQIVCRNDGGTTIFKSYDVEFECKYAINANTIIEAENPEMLDDHEDRITQLETDIGNTYTKTQTDTLLGDKVDKVTGKGLSANDFTNAYKTAVDNAVPNTRTINNKALNANVTLTTADIADSTDKRYISDAEKADLTNKVTLSSVVTLTGTANSIGIATDFTKYKTYEITGSIILASGSAADYVRMKVNNDTTITNYASNSAGSNGSNANNQITGFQLNGTGVYCNFKLILTKDAKGFIDVIVWGARSINSNGIPNAFSNSGYFCRTIAAITTPTTFDIYGAFTLDVGSRLAVTAF